jgi:hypothetical protein
VLSIGIKFITKTKLSIVTILDVSIIMPKGYCNQHFSSLLRKSGLQRSYKPSIMPIFYNEFIIWFILIKGLLPSIFLWVCMKVWDKEEAMVSMMPYEHLYFASLLCLLLYLHLILCTRPQTTTFFFLFFRGLILNNVN